MRYRRVLLISVDALSAKDSKPFEKYFNVKYSNYRTSHTWTLPSHISMLCGIFLSELSYLKEIKEIDPLKMADNLPSVATIFKQAGWKTRAIVGGGFLSEDFGWGRDWDEIQVAQSADQDWQGEKIVPRDREFLFLHTYFVHDWFNKNQQVLSFFNRAKKQGIKGKEVQFDLNLLREGKAEYHRRIKFFAQQLKWINDLSKDTLVFLTSDHGELFYPKTGHFHHGTHAHLNSEIFDVPLFVKDNNPDDKLIINNQFMYDLHLSKLIADYVDLPFISLRHYFQKNDQLQRQNSQLRFDLNKIQNSKAYQLWQKFCQIKKLLLGQ